MTARPILRAGHPVLRRRADPVADPRAPEIRALVADMLDSMEAANGAGLAAPQIGESLRVVIFTVPTHRMSEGESDAPEGVQVLINPVIDPMGEETALDWEGCLSLPGMRGEVRRHARIRYTGLGLDGEAIDRVAEGFHARVVQHEVDHLDGVLYPQRMEDMSRFGYTDELLAAADFIAPSPIMAGRMAAPATGGVGDD